MLGLKTGSGGENLRFLMVFLLLAGLPAFGQGLSLEGALNNLLKSPDWRSADLTYESAVRQLESAQAAAGLRVNGGSDYSLVNPLNPSGNSRQSLGLSSSATLGVLPWSSSFDAIRSAERGLVRAALDRRDTRNALVINLTQQYFNLQQAIKDAEIADLSLKLRENQVRIAGAQNQAGQITKEQLLSAQQNLETARLNASSAGAAVEIARLTLAGSLGLTVTEPTGRASEGEVGALDTLLSQAMAGRSDIRKAQSRLEDSQDTLAIAERDRWLPDAALTLGYRESTGQTAGASLSAGLNFKNGNATLTGSLPIIGETTTGTFSNNWSLGISLALPIVAPGSDNRIASAQTALEASRLALESAKRAAELDLRQRYIEAQNNKTRVSISRAALNTALQSLETAQARNQAGLNTALEVETARIARLQAERDLQGALVNLHIAVLRLKNATGVELMGGIK